jgi:hypothetical protein
MRVAQNLHMASMRVAHGPLSRASMALMQAAHDAPQAPLKARAAKAP